MPIQPQFGFILEYVTDIQAARRWYVEVLGLKVQREHAVFVQFEGFAIANDESLTGTREPEIYWVVEDAEAAYRELAAKGQAGGPPKQMPFGKVVVVNEPGGRPRFLLEWAADRPSVAVTPEADNVDRSDQGKGLA